MTYCKKLPLLKSHGPLITWSLDLNRAKSVHYIGQNALKRISLEAYYFQTF